MIDLCQNLNGKTTFRNSRQK